MKIIRKFSVKPHPLMAQDISDLTEDKSYPVLAVEKDYDDNALVLIASDYGRFIWLNIGTEEAYLASIDE